MSTTLLDDILKLKDVMPKKQRMLCQYLALNYEKIGVMTVAELAANAGVGTTTVLRLVQTLGYDSFSSFKRALSDLSMIQNATSYRGLKESFSDIKATESSKTLQSVTADGIRILQNLCTPSNVEQFETAIQLMLNAEYIYTIGMRSSKALALYFEYVVQCFCPKIRQLSGEGEFIFDRISVCMKPTDVLLAFSVWPTTKRTIEVGKICHKLEIPVILLTNTSVNPLIKFSDAVIDANCVNHSSGDTVLFALIEALAVELGRRMAPQSTKNLEYIEQVLRENSLVIRED